MRPRRNDRDEMAAIARRRLDLLSAELADLRAETDGRGGRPEPERDPVQRPESRPESRRETEVAGGRSEDPPAAHPAADPATDPAAASGHSPGRHARRSLSRTARFAGWVHDRLPSTLQGRVRLGPGHLTTVAVLAAVGLALTSWWVLRADGTTTVVPAATWTGAESSSAASSAVSAAPVALVTPGAEPATPDGAAGTDPAVVVVDVAGRVRRPGIATLPVGSRVVDALEAAGGARRGVDLTALNLARVLVDGEQVVVGVPPPDGVAAPAVSVPGASSTAAHAPLVDINAAGQAELEQLPGVGPVTAQAILQWRTDHGPFTAVDELLEVSGIGEATLAKIAPHVTL